MCTYVCFMSHNMERISYNGSQSKYFGKCWCRWSLRLFSLSYCMFPNAGGRGTLRDSLSPWDREHLHKRHLYFQNWIGFPPTEKCGVGTEGRRGNGIPGRGTIVNKGPVVGLCLVYSRESCDTGAERDWEVLRLDRWAGATAGGGPWLPHGGFSYGVVGSQARLSVS